MIERHVVFHLEPDSAAEFQRFFQEEYRPAMEACPGFVSCSLLAPEGTELALVMVIRFENQEASASWRRSDVHQRLKPILKSFYSQSETAVYHVIA